MQQLALFSAEELRQPPLTQAERQQTIEQIIQSAELGSQYLYSVREAAGKLHLTYDEIQTLIQFYRLDAVAIRRVVRIPWWSLCEYLIDPADDVEESLQKYLDSLPHRKKEGKCKLTLL